MRSPCLVHGQIYNFCASFVAVLHDLNLATAYAERAIVLDAGRIIYDGSSKNLPTQFSQIVGAQAQGSEIKGEWRVASSEG